MRVRSAARIIVKIDVVGLARVAVAAVIVTVALAMPVTGSGSGPGHRALAASRDGQDGKATMSLQLSSAAFDDGESIPKRFTCQGSDVSPPLSWTDVPDGASSLALIVDDPDAPAGTWVHWVIFDMPTALTGLAEGVPADTITADGARQGINDFRRIGYGGPCPPAGEPHRYFFTLYALDVALGPLQDVTKDELLTSMRGHILAQSRLVGTYQRE